VRFSSTILYTAEVLPPKHEQPVHVLGYENTVQGTPTDRGLGNAMLLPIPAVPGTMSQLNCIPTKWCPRILQDYSLALIPPLPASAYMLLSSATPPKPERVQMFESGIYTVVLAENAEAIPAALSRVPERKRPTMNPALFEAYSAWYPNWTFALCCFNVFHAAHATPMLWWYEPMNPNVLFAPGVDCHTGDVPDLTAEVVVDHTIIAGSYLLKGGKRVRFRDWFGSGASPYLCPRVIGGRTQRAPDGYVCTLPNGDFTIPVEDTRAGRFKYERVKPPAA